MHVLRGVLALSLVVSLCAYNLSVYAGGKPLGILTLAYGAHLNASDAFAGLSVFDGESLSTDEEGKLSARIGGSVITLIEQSAATLQRSGDGAHIDLDAGVGLCLVGGKQSVGGACGRRFVAAARWAPDAGAGSDVCAEGSADHDAAGKRGFLVREGVSRFAGGADVPHLSWNRRMTRGAHRPRVAVRRKRGCPPGRRWRISFWRGWGRGLRPGGFTI